MCEHYDILLTKWQSVIKRAKKFDEHASIEIREKASMDELQEIEAKLGIKLPPSFQDAILSIGKSFRLSYFFSDYILPNEWKNIFSGGLSWDISALISMTTYNLIGFVEDGNDNAEDKAYAEKMKGLYRFSESGNGDVYAFDMSADTTEKPVVYWNHETGEVSYLANSFEAYLEKITELYCIGNEIEQFEDFLDESGLNTSSEKAQNWKKWFEYFTTTELVDVRDDFDKLFWFTMCRSKKMDEQIVAALLSYDKAILFEKLKEALNGGTKQQEEAACKLMALFIGDYAQNWLAYFWDNAKESEIKYSDCLELNDVSISSRLLAYLSATCMDKANGMERVTRLLIKRHKDEKDLDISAYDHLKYFDAKQVIPWIEVHMSPRPYYWGKLFIEVKPEWDVFIKWSKLDKKFQAVLVQGFHHYISKFAYEIANLPPKEELQLFLNKLKEVQLLSTSKRQIDEVLSNIGCFYKHTTCEARG